MLPTTIHEFAAIFMHDADFLVAIVGAVAVAPAEEIVVVPGVTADTVVVPAPPTNTFNTVPTGNATEASVGILKSLDAALLIVTILFNPSAKTAV
jgi:hypothetical protein